MSPFNNSTPLTTILFDLDGTLVQHGHVLLPEKLAQWGYPRTQSEVDAAFLTQLHQTYEYIAQLRDRGRSVDQAVWARAWSTLQKRVLAQLEIPDPDDVLLKKMSSFFASDPVPPLFEDVPPVITELRAAGWQLGIITQRGRAGAEHFLDKHGLHDDFDVLIAGDDGFGRKPHAEPFHAALARLGAAPHEAIYVGDRIDDDCVGASQAGLATAFLIDRIEFHPGLQDSSGTDLVDYVRIEALGELLHQLPPTPAIKEQQ
jgi:phosphoglycolate phosphatase-like HAD superfamily hydrolase